MTHSKVGTFPTKEISVETTMPVCNGTNLMHKLSSVYSVNIDLYVLDLLVAHHKGKAIPLQALTGPEGSRGLRLTDF
jgi:hypothetical protein